MNATTRPAMPGIGIQFWRLTKPRVVSLIVFTAVIGMLLASPTLAPFPLIAAATIGIALVAGAAAAFNCLVEQKIDSVMARTRGRPTVIGTISTPQIMLFSGAVGGLGLAILWHAVNPLTMWLTLGTFVGYAVIYTVILKPATPQNIVIGGASGAMPPVLGWAAVTGDVTYQPLLLFLIIFAWTPPHFWALALLKKEEYRRVGIPMLPAVYGDDVTKRQILIYTIVLAALTLVFVPLHLMGVVYLASAILLDVVFFAFAIWVVRTGSQKSEGLMYRFSMLYLALLFVAMAIDRFGHGVSGS